MKIHELKIDHVYYEASRDGLKTFEIRKNDRDFENGDILILREWDETHYTGREHYKMITYILQSDEFLQPGYVCLSLAPISARAVMMAQNAINRDGGSEG